MEAKLNSLAADLVKKSVIDCDADETIDNAIRKMMQYKVSCLPVKHKEGNEVVYRGLMDWKHTIPYLISQNQHLKSIDEFEITTYATGGKVMVKELDLDVLCKGGSKITIKTAIIELGKSGAHQIYIEKCGLVSLTDILELLQEDIPKVTLGDMVKEKHIYHITSAQPVKDALQLMHDHWVSSCAVLDRGELLGNISVGDLRKISCELHFHSLSLSANQFIKQVKYEEMISNKGQDSLPVYQLSKQSDLHHAVKLMLLTKTHRVWMTNPFGVLTMSDVIAYLAKEIAK